MRLPVSIGLSVLVASASAAGPLETLEALGAALRSQPTWQAGYQQRYLPAGMTSGDEAEGEVWIAWPDRARFRTTAPDRREMALEGRRVRLLDVELSSCDDHLVSDDEWARIPLAVVLDPRGAVERFSVVETGERGVALIPREPGGVARVEILVDAQGMPSEVVVVDVQGARNRLVFSGWRASSGPPGGTWLPPPESGVSCVEDLGAE